LKYKEFIVHIVSNLENVSYTKNIEDSGVWWLNECLNQNFQNENRHDAQILEFCCLAALPLF